MNDHAELEKEILTRLYHAESAGLGKEILDNYRGEREVAECIHGLKERGLIQHGKENLEYPIKLTAAGVEMAKGF